MMNETSPSGPAHRVAPETAVVWSPTEEMLRRVWTTVLGTAPTERQHTFVELGGDSISATLCAHQLWEALAVDVPSVALLAKEATLANLAEAIDRGDFTLPGDSPVTAS
jgi:hypothetical protein